MEEIILAPVRIKLEEGAKGEIKASVAIDGDDENLIIDRITKAFKKLKAEMEVKDVFERKYSKPYC